MWLGHIIGRTVRADCWWPEAKEPLVQIFFQGFPCFTGGSGHEEWHSEIGVCSAALLTQASTTLPIAHLRMGVSVPWFGMGLLHASWVLGPIFLSPLWPSQNYVPPGEVREAEMGGLGPTSGGNVAPGWRHLVDWQAGRRGPGALQVGCYQTGALWDSSWPHG